MIMKRVLMTLLALSAIFCIKAVDFVEGDFGYNVITFQGTTGVEIFSYQGDLSAVTQLVIPDEVVHDGVSYPVIGLAGKFGLCKALEEVTFGRNLLYVVAGVFFGSAPVKRIVWKSVKRVEVLPIITQSANSPVNMVYHSEEPTIGVPGIGDLNVVRLEEIVICDGVEEITGEFVQRSPITSLHLPASLRELNPLCFWGCTQLQTVTVDPSNPVFDSRSGCNAVINTANDEMVMACRTTRIPSTVSAIGPDAYSPFTDMKSVVIPAWITNIGEAAFLECECMEEVHCRIPDPGTVTLGPGVFQSYLLGEWHAGVPESCTLYVPAGSRSLYRKADQWKRFKNIVEETPYEGPEDVNGDGRVDIDDVNAVINTMLKR